MIRPSAFARLYGPALWGGAALFAGERVVRATPAMESPRHVSMGNATRASAMGSNAAWINASAMHFGPQFLIDPSYQVSVRSQTHSAGLVIMDSLNNPRFGLALGYAFLHGAPTVSFTEISQSRKLKLTQTGHEAFIAFSIALVKNWLSIGIKPKYQFLDTRYKDRQGRSHGAAPRFSAFGLDLSMTANFKGLISVAFTADNLAGSRGSILNSVSPTLPGFTVDKESLRRDSLRTVADYPLALAHGLAIFPLRRPDFNLNFDGYYDLTSYKHTSKHVRMNYGGSAEYWIKMAVPLRVGFLWDGRDTPRNDDRTYITVGLGYARAPKPGSIGLDIGVGARQQLTGPQQETVLGVNIGLRMFPTLR